MKANPYEVLNSVLSLMDPERIALTIWHLYEPWAGHDDYQIAKDRAEAAMIIDIVEGWNYPTLVKAANRKLRLLKCEARIEVRDEDIPSSSYQRSHRGRGVHLLRRDDEDVARLWVHGSQPDAE